MPTKHKFGHFRRSDLTVLLAGQGACSKNFKRALSDHRENLFFGALSDAIKPDDGVTTL